MAHEDPNASAPLVTGGEEGENVALGTAGVDVDQLIEEGVKAKLAELGITVPEPAVKPTALERLSALAGEIEDSTFVQRLETLAAEGYQAAVDGEPAVKALVSVVGELVEKV